jgi:hypothetical protein
LQRVKTYNPNGRLQTEDEARQIDESIRNILMTHGIPYVPMVGCRESVMEIADIVERSVLAEREKAV